MVLASLASVLSLFCVVTKFAVNFLLCVEPDLVSSLSRVLNA